MYIDLRLLFKKIHYKRCFDFYKNELFELKFHDLIKSGNSDAFDIRVGQLLFRKAAKPRFVFSLGLT